MRSLGWRRVPRACASALSSNSPKTGSSLFNPQSPMIIRDDEFADIPTSQGPMRSYIFRPAAPGKYPGVLFYSEIFQVTGPIRRAAAMLTGQGYVLLVPVVSDQAVLPGTDLY